MFNFFKRPIVINFTVEQVHPNSTISLIKTDSNMSEHIGRAIANAWKDSGFKQRAVVIDKRLSIESLTDEDLKHLGLMRIPNETTNTRRGCKHRELQGRIVGVQVVVAVLGVGSKAKIHLRDKYTCQCCGVVTMELELDHIINIAQGGNDDESNLQSLCVPCHKTKTSKESKR